MRTLGIEGTAWAASAAIYDDESGVITMETDPYEPDLGGIDPTEAAEHMSGALPAVIGGVLDQTGGQIDGVAFSRGPGLGPCLRMTATAARTVADMYDAPLAGVNHMIAHAEIGRHFSDFDDPIVLNASGANAHVLGFRNERYRVLGETMDTGVGNAIDKFTRHLGWRHPGGPKVEERALTGNYVDLPYVVKGMDFSFSGLSSAAKAAVDDDVPIQDVCCGLQETIFAMLTEVTERAMALTHRDEVVVGGGVARNERLREMLETMVEDRGARLFVPPVEYLGDNGGMIAVTGAKMVEEGRTIPIESSTVDPDFRPEEVPIVWRSEPNQCTCPRSMNRGAEAIVREISEDTIEKRRISKPYRHPQLDERLRRTRTKDEARLLHAARQVGVPTPVVLDVDPETATIVMTNVGTDDFRDAISPSTVRTIGAHLGRLHRSAGIVHGDPTVRNVRVDADRVYLIDFGLGFRTDHVEDQAMDLHIFLQSLQDLYVDADELRAMLLRGYASTGFDNVEDRLLEIERRGRYR